MNIERLLPEEIEKRSFEIIGSELGDAVIPDEQKPVVIRVIHTTADFDYVNNLYFSETAVKTALEALKAGAVIITDTNMTRAGINQAALNKLNCETLCFMADEDVALTAKKNNTTRAAESVNKAADGLRPMKPGKPVIYAVGNAPTALIRLYELINSGEFVPELIIGVPVGFVNVTQSKELIMRTDVPCITARGRKGGSSVAAAICNALLYEAAGRAW
jgi:precorrin-8X/cobalt-precorrin-8 methylmutase